MTEDHDPDLEAFTSATESLTSRAQRFADGMAKLGDDAARVAARCKAIGDKITQYLFERRDHDR